LSKVLSKKKVNFGSLTEELIQRMSTKMEKHVIVVGYAFLGKYVVESLQRLELDFIVITRTEGQLEVLKSHNIPALFSPITHLYEALKEANVEKASTLISTLEVDGENMLTVMTAKKLNPNLKTVSVVSDKDLIEGLMSAGADVAVPYFDVMGRMLAASSLAKETVGVFFPDELRAKFVAEFRVEASGITCKDISGICPILMISRSDQVIYDIDDSLKLKEGDFVYVLTDQESIGAFRDRFKSLTSPAKPAKPQ
jgi:voltage-gated potassium channel Kch